MWNPFSDTAEGTVKGFGEAIKDAVGAFKADPTKVLEFEQAVTLATMQFQATLVQSVNATMQAETKSEHWLQYSWRPFGAYLFYFLLVHNYVISGYLLTYLHVTPTPIPMEVWYIFLTLLGVAAWTRGQSQIEQARK
jgi:hypothetical protein